MRFLIDDGAFIDLDKQDPIEAILVNFAREVHVLRTSVDGIGVLTNWASISVGDSDLGEFLTSVAPKARDSARLLMSALDKCFTWDQDPTLEIDPAVLIDGNSWSSYAVAYSAQLKIQKRVVGCLTFGHCFSAGIHAVTQGDGNVVEVVLVLSADDAWRVHRSRFKSEDTPEADFFAVARSAFPNLILVDALTFRRFSGDYRVLRDSVVAHLAVLNDKFTQEYVAANGDLRVVSARTGIQMSIEGTTRSSPTLMRLRDVECGGRSYRCEIHTKISPNRNRIHFHPGDEASGGRVVVGIFVDHLKT